MNAVQIAAVSLAHAADATLWSATYTACRREGLTPHEAVDRADAAVCDACRARRYAPGVQ